MNCVRCLKPETDEIHGPVEDCVECKQRPGEEKAHHAFQDVEPAIIERQLFHALAN